MALGTSQGSGLLECFEEKRGNRLSLSSYSLMAINSESKPR
jgi:hypothetical protein